MKTILFDFDGVIADSTEAIMQTLKVIAKLKKVKPLTTQEHSYLSTKDLFKRLNIKWYQIPYYVSIARKLVKRKKILIKITGEFLVAIKNINFKKFNFIIISSNSNDVIKYLMSKYLNDINFFEIYGSVPIFSKHRVIKNLIKKNYFKKNDAILIGDEVRDIVAAKKAGIQSIAVTWGKDSLSLLNDTKPDYVVNTGRELALILEKF